MIVCSCNVLTKASVVEAARRCNRERSDRAVTAGRILRELEVRPQCGVCLSLIRTLAAEEGVTVTCPEPIASVAEEGQQLSAK